jgi:hypothetical protein
MCQPILYLIVLNAYPIVRTIQEYSYHLRSLQGHNPFTNCHTLLWAYITVMTLTLASYYENHNYIHVLCYLESRDRDQRRRNETQRVACGQAAESVYY